MIFRPDEVQFLPDGSHQRLSCCVALVGPMKAAIRWAVSAMQIQYPVNAERGIFCLAHDNLDVSRNLTIRQWRRSVKDGQKSWIVLVPSDEQVPWDVAVRGVLADAPVVKIGSVFVLRADAVGEPPWFRGAWTGQTPLELAPTPESASQQVAQPTGPKEPEKAIAVCVPSLGTTSTLWTTHAMQLAGPITSARALVVAVRYEVGEARQSMVASVLAMNPRPKYVLFYGDDMIPPPNALWLLYETIDTTDAPAVAGLYYMKTNPPQIPLLWRNKKPGVLVPGRDFEVGDTVEVDGTGLDFVLLRTDALAAMPPLRFKTVMEWREDCGVMIQTEDAFFWDRFRETHGRGPLVDTRCRVGHYSVHDGGIY